MLDCRPGWEGVFLVTLVGKHRCALFGFGREGGGTAVAMPGSVGGCSLAGAELGDMTGKLEEPRKCIMQPRLECGAVLARQAITVDRGRHGLLLMVIGPAIGS
jgi:hypothetical protein